MASVSWSATFCSELPTQPRSVPNSVAQIFMFPSPCEARMLRRLGVVPNIWYQALHRCVPDGLAEPVYGWCERASKWPLAPFAYIVSRKFNGLMLTVGPPPQDGSLYPPAGENAPAITTVGAFTVLIAVYAAFSSAVYLTASGAGFQKAERFGSFQISYSSTPCGA
jgi:hypothetical protein